MNELDHLGTIEAMKSTSTFLSTVSADIDNVPTDQFGKIFAGGIFVMFGSVVSTMIVGSIIEKSGIYGDIVADSYSEEIDDKLFNQLSSEDKEELRKLITDLEASGENKDQELAKELSAKLDASEKQRALDETEFIEETKPIGKKIDNFSDY